MEEKGNGHIQSYRQLALILGLLVILTGATIGVSRLNLGGVKIFTALAVASVKAALVLIFFMQIREAGRAVVRTFIITLIILAIFIGFIFFDVAYR